MSRPQQGSDVWEGRFLLRAARGLSVHHGVFPERLDILAECGIHLWGDIPAEARCIGHVGLIYLCINPEANARFAGLRDHAPTLGLAKIILWEHLILVGHRHTVSFPHGWRPWPKSAGYPVLPHRHRPRRAASRSASPRASQSAVRHV